MIANHKSLHICQVNPLAILKKSKDWASFKKQLARLDNKGKGGTVPSDTILTYAFNWCVSPLTPMGVAGVIWMPSESNLGEAPAHYAAELETYAKRLPDTYGQENIQFLYAQPASSLVEGITSPKIPGAKSTSFDQWPKSLAVALAKLAK